MFESIGAIGLLLISAGIVAKARQRQDWLYIIGGVCLEIYSIHVHDIIFITLQIVFTLAAMYDLITVSRRKSRKHAGVQ